MTIAFIGAGKMATALAEGINSSRSDIRFAIYDVYDESIKSFTARIKNCSVCASVKEAAEQADVLFLSVKPQNFTEISESISTYRKIIVSIMAGVSIAKIKQYAEDAQVIRVMPNTPCLVGQMAAGYSTGSNVTDESAALAKSLLETSGVAVRLDEKFLDAVTALSGSGPAFAGLILKYFLDGALALGLDEQTAKALLFQTFTGTIELLKIKNLSFNDLLTMVTSKGGTTAAGREVLENSDVADIISKTLAAANNRSEELGKQ